MRLAFTPEEQAFQAEVRELWVKENDRCRNHKTHRKQRDRHEVGIVSGDLEREQSQRYDKGDDS